MPEHDHTRPGAGEPGVEPGLTAGGTSGLADVLTVVGGLVRDAEVPPSVEECEALLTGLNTVSYVVEGLADKIRASGAVRGPTAAQVSVRMARLTCVVATVPINDVDEAHELTARLREFVDTTLTRLEELPGEAAGWS